MGMITIWWSLKQRHQRQASIMSIYFNLPFAAIALIFLMSCSLGKILFALDFIFKNHDEKVTKILILETYMFLQYNLPNLIAFFSSSNYNPRLFDIC